jgi:cell division protein FtsI/penicillin-binding protein 2
MPKNTRKSNHQKYQYSTGTEKVNFRLVFIFISIFLGFSAVTAKLYFIQIQKHGYYSTIVVDHRENMHILAARRGTIYDRNGKILARDILQYSVAILKNRLQDGNKTLKKTSQILGIPASNLRKKLKEKSNFVYIKHQVFPEQAEQLERLKNPAIHLEKKFQRIYPHNHYAAHVLGFCNLDNKPLGGVEYQYNKYLEGKPGWEMLEMDGIGRRLPNLDLQREDPINGFDIRLTLDVDFQMIVDDELARGVQNSNAADGIAILMNSNTGEILSLANYPSFNPAKASQYRSEILKNRAILDVIEPGSTFKIVTLAAALEVLKVKIDQDIVFCENGSYAKSGHNFRDYEKFAWLTARKVFENSSNIGVVKIAERLKKEVLYRYTRNFGFGMSTGIDLPGESSGILHPLNNFSKTSHLFMSFGYEIGVTPLQLISAYAIPASGGHLMKPYVLKTIFGDDGREYRENEPEKIRTVISQDAASLMTDVLLGAVKNGTGKEAFIDNIAIAGKTGTAQLYDIEKGAFDSRKHLASFVGYFPAYSPKFVLLIMIRHPKGKYYGGLVAAPVFRKIVQRIMSINTIPDLMIAGNVLPASEVTNKNIPNVVNLTPADAIDVLKQLDLKYSFVGKGNIVIRQEKSKEFEQVPGVVLYLDQSIEYSEKIMPSVTGLTMKEALSLLNENKILCEVQGSGIVISQLPKAGSKISNGGPVKVVCKPS